MAYTFKNTSNLPSLPVPSLRETTEKYIKCIQPLVNENELKTALKLLEELNSPNGVGSLLQKLLLDRAQSRENWLTEWWENKFLADRNSVIFVDPGILFPFQNFKDRFEWISYTANLISATLRYKLAIDSNQIPVDKMGEMPLDMSQYRKFFGSCRIPGKPMDTSLYNVDSQHIMISRNNNFYKLRVLNAEKEIMNFHQLIKILEYIVKQSDVCGHPIGIFTSDNRDSWFRAHEELIKDPVNRKSLEEIQKSLFFVALDNPMPRSNDTRINIANKQIIHGGGSKINSANRWFDMTIQLIVSEDGTVGLNYEHSLIEGQPVARIVDYIVDSSIRPAEPNIMEIKISEYPEKMVFNINDTIKEYIHVAESNVDSFEKNLDVVCFKFTSFGKEFIKSQNFSPDSLIQIALQYTFYRLHEVPAAHQESIALRKYIYGRTEINRCCSTESVDFAKAMLDNEKSVNEKFSAMKSAITSHKAYTNKAHNGFGVDRHFFGLKNITVENGLKLPEIFDDPSFTRSLHMRLNTSQVAMKCDGLMGYAPQRDDGYGCCYNPRSYDINFSISAYVKHPDTCAKTFSIALEKSLLEMRDLIFKAKKPKL